MGGKLFISGGEVFHSVLEANFPLKSGGAVIGGGLALLGIEVTIGVVAEHCGCLKIPTVDHFPLINTGWLAGVVLEDGAFAPLFCAAKRRHK